MYPFASLPENLAAFCETLRRQHAFHIGPGELHDAARALDVVNVADEQTVRHALRPILVSTLDDVAVFDAVFTQFFLRGEAGVPQDRSISTRREPAMTGADDGAATDADRAHRAAPTDADADDAAAPSGGPMIAAETTGDAREDAAMLARSSYSPLDANASGAPELPSLERAWQDAARVFVRHLYVGRSRRWRPSSRGRRFDLRRTLRASLQTGGEPLSSRWLQRPRQAPRIVRTDQSLGVAESETILAVGQVEWQRQALELVDAAEGVGVNGCAVQFYREGLRV